MANEQNLIPQAHVLTVEEASKGGIASGKARRDRKLLKEELLLLLSEGDVQKAVVVALINKALAGDTKAFEVIRDSIGEKCAERVVFAEVDPSVIAQVEGMVQDDAGTGG